MIPKNITSFLKSLEKNNNKAWFDAHKKEYDIARADFFVAVDAAIKSIASFDPDIQHLTAKECVFRINRDVRFAKDKRPYKNNMSAYFNRAGKKGTGAGYYMHIEPGKSFAAAGVWMPEAAELAKIRQEIDYNADEFTKILSATTFKKHFASGLDNSNSLVRPPKGYSDDNPAIEYLKLKSFVVTRPFTDEAIAEKGFINALGKTFQAVKPMLDFINRGLD